MKRLLLLMAAGLLQVSPVMSTPTQTYENPANVVVISQIVIDAVNFVNKGTFSFSVYPYLPYETFDTLNYTNYGTILMSPGWRFDLNSTETGKRSWANNFYNFNLGTVTSLDSYNSASGTLIPCAIAVVDPSYLWISATNIVTQAGVPTGGASLSVGPDGQIKIEGKNVDLSRSGLQVLPVWDETFGTSLVGNPPASFIPDIAVFDDIWAQGSYSPTYGLNFAGLWNGVTANAPGTPQPNGLPAFTIINPTADSFVSSQFQVVTITNYIPVTNVFTDVTNGCSVTNVGVQEVDVPVTIRSNVVQGAVFVGVPAGFNTPQIGFVGSTQPNNPYRTASAVISVLMTNTAIGQMEPAYIEVQDTLASDTTLRGTIPNDLGCGAVTQRPLNYLVDRLTSLLGGAGNNGYPLPDFFISSASQPLTTNVLSDAATNTTVIQGDYAGYSAVFDNIVTRPPSVPGGTAGTTPGRIDINAENLNLNQTRLRGEGFIQITSPHLVSSTNASVDVESLSLNLTSTNGTLRIRNLTPDSGVVPRMRGTVNIWSAVWVNSVVVTLTNNYILTNVPVFSPCDTNNPPAVIGTNTVVVGFTNIPVVVTVSNQVLMVDGSGLVTTVPVSVYDLTTHSPNVIMGDNMTVVQSLLIDGKSFTLNGSLTIPGSMPPNPVTGVIPSVLPLYNWESINAPNLLYFTNNGTLNIINEAHFGDDRATAYARFVNTGLINSGSLDIDSDSIRNTGNLISTYGLTFHGGSGVFPGGSSSSGGSTTFSMDSVKFDQYRLTALDSLELLVTNNLSDSGDGSGNVFQLNNGFNLRRKPIAGDLLGTTINDGTSFVPSIQISHLWAGEDRGASPAGYTNNTAIGVLRLSSQSPNPLFSFAGTGNQNALYVDRLDLSALTDYTNQIQIANNLVIYFAAANLSFTPPPDTNGIAQEPEEFLDGQFGGRLRWVSSYAGPNSSQAVIIGGQSQQVNGALRNSLRIDSNGNGTANGNEAEPFNTAPVEVVVNGNGSITPYSGGSVPLLYGSVYSLMAQPAPGAVFTGWTGSIESSSPVLVFTNTGGLQFTANFSFQVTPGTYNGLFYQLDGVQFYQSGYFTATTTKNGAYSGYVMMGKEKFPFSGDVDESGFSSPSATLDMELQFTSNSITGTVGDYDQTWTAELQAERTGFAKSNPAPAAGKYTIVFPGGSSPTNTLIPFGTGFGTVQVDSSGKIKLKGSLADGTKLTQSSLLTSSGLWPLYAPLYNGGGQILGWMSFNSASDEDVGGLFNWIKELNDADNFYPDGFNFTTNATGSRFDSTWTPLTGFPAATVTLIGGNLTNTINNGITISQDNKITDLSTNKLKLSINKSQGLFKGSVINPATGKPVNFNGALLQKQGVGSGYFLGTDQSGKVIVSP